MTAEIIDMWLSRNIKTDPRARVFFRPRRVCVTEYTGQGRTIPDNCVIDRDCRCAECRDFFATLSRTTQQILRDMSSLTMSGPEDEDRRHGLIQELRDNSNPFTARRTT